MPVARVKLDSIRRKGKEYVSRSQFAERVGVSRQAIDAAVKRGTLSWTTIDGVQYLEYETEKVKWDRYVAEGRHRGSNSLRPSRRKKGEQELLKKASFKKAPEVKDLNEVKVTVENVVGEIEDEKGNKITISGVDPYANLDCCMLTVNDDGTKDYVRDEKGVPQLDYERLEQKYVALIRVQQYRQKSEELVEKTMVTETLQKVLPPLRNSIIAIPQRYATRVIAYLKKQKISVNNDLSTGIQNILRDEANQILRNLQRNVEDTVNG